MHRHCPDCGTRLTRGSTRGGLPRQYCPNCDDDADGGDDRV